MDRDAASAKTLCMKRTKELTGPPRHFLRKWREHCRLTLAEVDLRMEALAVDARTGTTHGNLSRIERGEVPYNQVLLESLAKIYETDPASLIVRDPSQPDPIWTVLDRIPASQREQLSDVMRAFAPPETATPPPARAIRNKPRRAG